MVFRRTLTGWFVCKHRSTPLSFPYHDSLGRPNGRPDIPSFCCKGIKARAAFVASMLPHSCGLMEVSLLARALTGVLFGAYSRDLCGKPELLFAHRPQHKGGLVLTVRFQHLVDDGDDFLGYDDERLLAFERVVRAAFQILV